MSKYNKSDRLLGIFLRLIRGSDIRVSKLAREYDVTTKTISRDINDLRAFFANNQALSGGMDIIYSRSTGAYALHTDEFLQAHEMFSVIKILLGTRALDKEALLKIKNKLKQFTSVEDNMALDTLVANEFYHYSPVKSDCKNLIDNLWRISKAIYNKDELRITYYKMDRTEITRRIQPVSIIFSEFYFYVFAYHETDSGIKLRNYRLDRITHIVKPRDRVIKDLPQNFDEGEFRKLNRYMFPGRNRIIRFEFTGPSVQAVLDKLPTAEIVDADGEKYTIKARVHGDGIKMFLLSQGSWVKVLEPQEFADELKNEITKMLAKYEGSEKNEHETDV